MPAARALPRRFFARATVSVARDLVGARLLCDPGTDDEVEAVLVEVEAYLGMDDPASHAFRGDRGRAAVMFGAPGHLYAYLSYGMHVCANVVTGPAGVGGAVLLRAAVVERGEAAVRRRRRPGKGDPGLVDLLRGPGNLGAGLGLGIGDNGLDLCAPGARLRILEGSSPALVTGPRVGISQAVERPLRFAWAGHPAVSKPVPGGSRAQRVDHVDGEFTAKGAKEPGRDT